MSSTTFNNQNTPNKQNNHPDRLNQSENNEIDQEISENTPNEGKQHQKQRTTNRLNYYWNRSDQKSNNKNNENNDKDDSVSVESIANEKELRLMITKWHYDDIKEKDCFMDAMVSTTQLVRE